MTVNEIIGRIKDMEGAELDNGAVREALAEWSIGGSLCHNPELHKFGSLPCCEGIHLAPDQDLVVAHALKHLKERDGI